MKRCLLLAALLGSLVSLTSCGGGGNSESEESGLKVLHLPMRTNGPSVIDPVQGSSVYDNRVCSQVYETLVDFHYLKRPSDGSALQPLLLEEMPTISEDGRTYKFKLKKGVRFHDDPCFPDGEGREVVSSDVFYSWKRMADNDNNPRSWWLLENTIVGFDDYRATQNAAETFDYDAEVEGFKIIDDREFEVMLVEPVYRFMYVLAMFQLSVVPREAVETYGDSFGNHPVGTGPFTIAEDDWKKNVSLTMNRNPNYHACYYPEIPSEDYTGKDRDIELGFYEDAGKQLPLVDRIEITMYNDDQPMWLKFRSKELDYTQVPAENFEEAFNLRNQKLRPEYRDEGIVDHAVVLLDFIFIGFNMEDETLGGYTDADKYLRQAICLAIDWNARNNAFYNGLTRLYDGPIPPGLQGHPEGGRTDPSYRGPDLARARDLLAKAGYPDGEGLPALDFYISRQSNAPEQADMLEQQLAQINVKIKKNIVEFSTLMDLIHNKQAPFFSFAWGSDYPDAENNLALFFGPNKSPGSNHFNYQRDEFDELYRQTRSMAPTEERGEMYARMRDMVIEDAPFAGSQGRTRYYLVNPRLENFKPSEDFYSWIKYMDLADE